MSTDITIIKDGQEIDYPGAEFGVPVASRQFIQRAADLQAFNDRLRQSFGLEATARTQNGLTPDKQVASMTGWVHVCVSRIRNGVARVPCRVYRVSGDGEQADEILDQRHELVRLLNNRTHWTRDSSSGRRRSHTWS